MRIQKVVIAAGLLLAAASTTILANDPSWTLRVHGAIIDSSGEDRTDVGTGVSSSVDVGGGFGIGAEYRLSNRYGLEFSTLFAGLEIDNSVSGGAGLVQSLEMSMMPLTFAFPFHFDAGDRADLFVAPTFSIVRYLDIETSISGAGVDSSVDVDSDAALGAALGVDVPFGKGKWAFSTSLRYMKTGFEGTDVDPVIVTLGFAYRFHGGA
jgi:outer membrane protein W